MRVCIIPGRWGANLKTCFGCIMYVFPKTSSKLFVHSLPGGYKRQMFHGITDTGTANIERFVITA